MTQAEADRAFYTALGAILEANVRGIIALWMASK